MTRSRASILIACISTLAGVAPALAASSDSPGPSLDELRTPVAAPYELAIRNRTWNGDTHATPWGRAELEADGQPIWELAAVTAAVASADGSTVALQTSDYQLYVSRLPEPPRRIEGGPYLSPVLSADGATLVAQRLGRGGHILEKTRNTLGIALIDLASGEDRLLVEGNDLYSPSFASDRMMFFGSGGRDQIASLYLLDLGSMSVARVTNREQGALQTFPSETPRLAGGTVVYRADDELFRVAVPGAEDFVPIHRFDAPKALAAEGVSPDYGSVRIRRPSTQINRTPKVYQYYDVDKRVGITKDWYCSKMTYDQHQGTDFNQQIGNDVVAPASGTVILRYDGCSDTNSKGCGTGWGNFAAMRHADGSVSLEAHGQKWSVAALGASLSCGARLMRSAKSGNANLPHVHHESWIDQTGNVNKSKRYDPYLGACDQGDPSKWTTQNGYRGLPAPTCQ